MATNIAAVGERDLILPFKAIGVQIFPVRGIEEVRGVMSRLIREDYGLILITEDLASKLEDLLKEVSTQPTPSIVPIPSSGGSTGFALGRLRETIKKAVGADILAEEGQSSTKSEG